MKTYKELLEEDFYPWIEYPDSSEEDFIDIPEQIGQIIFKGGYPANRLLFKINPSERKIVHEKWVFRIYHKNNPRNIGGFIKIDPSRRQAFFLDRDAMGNGEEIVWEPVGYPISSLWVDDKIEFEKHTQ